MIYPYIVEKKTYRLGCKWQANALCDTGENGRPVKLQTFARNLEILAISQSGDLYVETSMTHLTYCKTDSCVPSLEFSKNNIVY